MGRLRAHDQIQRMMGDCERSLASQAEGKAKLDLTNKVFKTFSAEWFWFVADNSLLVGKQAIENLAHNFRLARQYTQNFSLVFSTWRSSTLSLKNVPRIISTQLPHPWNPPPRPSSAPRRRCPGSSRWIPSERSSQLVFGASTLRTEPPNRAAGTARGTAPCIEAGDR